MSIPHRYEFSQEEMINANPSNYIYPLIYINEEFKRISDYIPEVADYYFISNYGRVFSGVYENIKATQISNVGYELVQLRRKDHSTGAYSIHRLVKLCFEPIENPENFQVNHKDGCKKNNYDNNLEWSTREENMYHCYRNNLEINGEDHPWSTISEEQAHQICKYMEMGYGDAHISRLIFGNRSKTSVVSGIRYGTSWVNVSMNYTFPKHPIENDKRRFSIPELERMYEIIQEGLKPKDVAIKFGIDIESYDEKDRERIYRIIRDLRDGKAYKYISNK